MLQNTRGLVIRTEGESEVKYAVNASAFLRAHTGNNCGAKEVICYLPGRQLK